MLIIYRNYRLKTQFTEGVRDLGNLSDFLNLIRFKI